MIMSSAPNYLIQIKVFLLAQLATTNYVAKVDMVIDLLLVIDGVRHYRGLVVFGTTHIPNVLDPALRRPGRFFFMIRVPFVPNWSTRLQIFKVSLYKYSKTFDHLDYVTLCKNYSEAQICHLISRVKLIFYNYEYDFLAPTTMIDESYPCCSDYSVYNPAKGFRFSKFFTHTCFNNIYSKNRSMVGNSLVKSKAYKKDINNILLGDDISLGLARAFRRFFDRSFKGQNKDSLFIKQQSKLLTCLPGAGKLSENKQKSLFDHLRRLTFYSYVPSGPSNILGITYSTVSKLLIDTLMFKDVTRFGFVLSSFKHHTLAENSANHTFNCLYYSMERLNIELLRLFSGKIGEFFLYSAVNRPDFNFPNRPNLPFSLSPFDLDLNIDTHASSSAESLDIVGSSLQNSIKLLSSDKKHVSLSPYGQNFKNFSHTFYTCYGSEDILSSVTNIAYSIMYKRYMYSKALLLDRSLSVINNSMLNEPITAPASFIETPADRYEHIKRYEKDYIKKSVISIRQKIEDKEHWLFIRYLSGKPLLQGYPFSIPDLDYSFKDHKHSQKNKNNNDLLLSNYKTIYKRFPFAPIDLIPLGKNFTQISQSAYYFRKNYHNRNFYSFYDYWYNLHLEEDTLEKTLSRETDSRYYYDERYGDMILEYPDADQYYNPRCRRWMCASGYWGQWGSFEKLYHQEIYEHYLYESFYKGFKFLENYREVLDHFAYKLLKNGILKEIDILTFLNNC